MHVQQAMCGSKKLLVESKCVGADAVWSGRARLLIRTAAGKRAGTITRNAYTQGKGELAWDAWPNRLVLRHSLQSERDQ